MTEGDDPSQDMRQAIGHSNVGEFSLAAKSISCSHCGANKFTPDSVQLNTTIRTLLDLDWTDRTATILICVACGQIQWFAEPPQKVT
jgi:hypothetical protein